MFVGTVVLKPATSSASLLIESADSWLLSSAPACIAAALAAMHHWGRRQCRKVVQNYVCLKTWTLLKEYSVVVKFMFACSVIWTANSFSLPWCGFFSCRNEAVRSGSEGPTGGTVWLSSEIHSNLFCFTSNECKFEWRSCRWTSALTLFMTVRPWFFCIYVHVMIWNKQVSHWFKWAICSKPVKMEMLWV